ncbi:MAG TPA: VanW family protein [Gaiellaceae bacterium]|nr:VanW family protein [Gaiellaceae bacterium]
MQAELAHQDAHAARRTRRRRQARNRAIRRLVAVVALLLAIGAFVVAVVYAGSPDTLPGGQTIAGVDVGGMTTKEAVQLLERKAAALAASPVDVRVAGRTFRLRQADLGIQVDWAGAVESARAGSGGFGPIRGFRRFFQELFGTSTTPAARAVGNKLDQALDRIVGSVGREPVNASIKLNGLNPVVEPGHRGISIDRPAAKKALLERFAGFSRAPVVLALSPQSPQVTTADLATEVAQVRTAVSSPVILRIGSARYPIGRWQLASMLELPRAGTRSISLGGKQADAFLNRLARALNRQPRDATFSVSTSSVRIVPDLPGRELNSLATAGNIVKAALSPTNRTALIAVDTKPAKRTAAQAKAMGVSELVGTYTTEFGGVPNRIHNVQLVSHLIDGTLIAPGATFSFNGTTGDRNASKGFLEAPVIINGELTTGLGGGVCQVSTTVFNAAFVAGLDITARTNHALYISHYPQGRDATVNYPDVDLKFVNDTKAWLLLRTFVSTYSLTVSLYGTNPHRRVESTTAPLVIDGRAPTQWVKDPTLTKGTKEIVDSGSPPLSTSVHRLVYDANGKLLYDNTWSSHYVGEKRIIHIGTKKPAAPKGPTGPSGAAGPTGPTGASGPTGPTGTG